MRLIAIIVAAGVMLGYAGAAHAEGDAENGEKVFKKCKVCHDVGEGAKHKVGPVLNDIIGRTAGTVDGFKYSAAMIKAGEGGMTWSEGTIDEYLANPRGFIPKNKMAFVGLKREEDRADVIAYLKQFTKQQ